MARAKGGIVVKKKIWVTIVAPKAFNEQEIGQIYLEEPQLGVGRTATVSLMTLTGEPKNQNVRVSFSIKAVSGSKLATDIIGYSLSPAATKRMVRRGKSKLQLSFTTKTKDNKVIRIKPLIITRGKPGGIVLTSLRNTAKAILIKELGKRTFEDLMKEVIQKKFQRALSDSLRKTYPIQLCEIKRISIESEEQAATEKTPEAVKA